ncbi:MAG: hypothetical protein JSV89_10625 [Spirochaetaceae bacterium]|nr:MAG: hypothetical protein JSV89_10625 [Spirochaetaceae bacterium]
MRRLLILLTFVILSSLPLAAQQNGGAPGTASGSAPGERQAPRLAGIVDLNTLSLLWNASGDRSAAAPEALDIATIPGGTILLFSDRFLSLGNHLEMTTRTMQDLAASPQLPKMFIPSRLLLNPLSEPMLYNAETGTLLLFHPDTPVPESFATEFPQAMEAGSLPRGGILLSDGKRLAIITRRGKGLSRREILLPTAYRTGLSIDAQERLWIYDLAARRVRVFDLNGEPLFSIAPDITGGTLLFPQVFQVRGDGGFFLGTAGELWCFNADGSVRWRLTQFNAGFRQALPAFYRLAVAKGSADGRVSNRSEGTDGTVSTEAAQSFYILDPLGNRIMKFVEQLPLTDGQGPGIESTLAAAFESSESLQARQNEILRLCLEEDMLLQAAFFRRGQSGEPVVTDLRKRIREKQARLLAELAGQLENELRYPEAETSYNRSLSLYRELRNLDPVDLRYPEAVRELSERRNAVRHIRVAENLLSARIAEDGLTAGADKVQLRIVLANTSTAGVEQVEFLAHLYGYPESRWQGTLKRISPGGEALLTIPLSRSTSDAQDGVDRLNSEDLLITCNLLARFEHNHQNAVQYFHLPVVFPAGTLHLTQWR